VVKNTAAAICLSNEILADRFGDRPIVFMPSDSVIQDVDGFRAAILSAVEFSWARNAVVTLGVSPQNPSSQYGYIKIRGAVSLGKKIFAVDKFVEKPDSVTAEKYLRSGKYLWNTGMVIATTGTIRRAFRSQAPDIHGNITDYINGDGDAYGLARKTSFDYAVLEKLSDLFAIAGSFSWDDVGSFEVLAKYRACGVP
jgi:mannose-1-phosphate guanylyltransferase